MAQNTGDNFQKNIAFPNENKLFAGDFCANLDETKTDMVQFTKKWNWKWIVYYQEDTFSESLTATNVSSVSSRLVSQVKFI